MPIRETMPMPAMTPRRLLQLLALLGAILVILLLATWARADTTASHWESGPNFATIKRVTERTAVDVDAQTSHIVERTTELRLRATVLAQLSALRLKALARAAQLQNEIDTINALP